MNFTFTVDVDGARHKFTVLEEFIKNPKSVLAEFDKHKRDQIAQIFAQGGPGWPARSERTDERVAAKILTAHRSAPERLRKKLVREFSRAKKRAAAKPGDAKKQAAVQRRYFVMKELERQMNGGTMALMDKSDKKLAKSVAGLQERRGRADHKSAGSLLGKIPQTIKSELKGASLTIGSTWEHAAVHNEGGTANHGATIPPRTFLEWREADMELLRVLLIEAGLLVMES